MTVVIKSAAISGADWIQPFEGRTTPSTVSVSREILLEERIAELEAEMLAHDAALSKKVAKAHEDGAREALKQRSEVEALALKELKAAFVAAHKSWSDRLQSWDALSVGIARAVLEQVFAGSNDRVSQIVDMIKYHLQRLEAGSSVRIRVSAQDFNAEQLSAAALELDAGVEAVSDSELASGDCVIDLKLGHIDVGLNAQWGRITHLLERLESEDSKP